MYIVYLEGVMARCTHFYEIVYFIVYTKFVRYLSVSVVKWIGNIVVYRNSRDILVKIRLLD